LREHKTERIQRHELMRHEDETVLVDDSLQSRGTALPLDDLVSKQKRREGKEQVESVRGIRKVMVEEGFGDVREQIRRECKNSRDKQSNTIDCCGESRAKPDKKRRKGPMNINNSNSK